MNIITLSNQCLVHWHLIPHKFYFQRRVLETDLLVNVLPNFDQATKIGKLATRGISGRSLGDSGISVVSPYLSLVIDSLIFSKSDVVIDSANSSAVCCFVHW